MVIFVLILNHLSYFNTILIKDPVYSTISLILPYVGKQQYMWKTMWTHFSETNEWFGGNLLLEVIHIFNISDHRIAIYNASNLEILLGFLQFSKKEKA